MGIKKAPAPLQRLLVNSYSDSDTFRKEECTMNDSTPRPPSQPKKTKGHKVQYRDRWHRDELRPAVALQGLAVVGPRLRLLIAEIHYEHRTRRPDPKEE